MDEFADAPADALTTTKPELASDQEFDRRSKRAQAERAEQDNDHRKTFVKWVIRAVTGTLAVSVALMVLYVISEWGHIAPQVMVAWFSATVVQTLGLAYVIARYLFPAGKVA